MHSQVWHCTQLYPFLFIAVDLYILFLLYLCNCLFVVTCILKEGKRFSKGLSHDRSDCIRAVTSCCEITFRWMQTFLHWRILIWHIAFLDDSLFQILFSTQLCFAATSLVCTHKRKFSSIYIIISIASPRFLNTFTRFFMYTEQWFWPRYLSFLVQIVYSWNSKFPLGCRHFESRLKRSTGA